MMIIQSLRMLEMRWGPMISVEANLLQQVKRSGRSQKSPAGEHDSAMLSELPA